MTKKEAIKQASESVNMYRFGNDWSVNFYRSGINMTQQGPVGNYWYCRSYASSCKIEKALELLGYDEEEIYSRLHDFDYGAFGKQWRTYIYLKGDCCE